MEKCFYSALLTYKAKTPGRQECYDFDDKHGYLSIESAMIRGMEMANAFYSGNCDYSKDRFDLISISTWARSATEFEKENTGE